MADESGNRNRENLNGCRISCCGQNNCPAAATRFQVDRRTGLPNYRAPPNVDFLQKHHDRSAVVSNQGRSAAVSVSRPPSRFSLDTGANGITTAYLVDCKLAKKADGKMALGGDFAVSR